MLILMAHTVNEWTTIQGPLRQLFSLYNFAVPFFFTCSGFLFFCKLETLTKDGRWEYYKEYSLRLGKMYLAWSAIYFTFVLTKWLIYGVHNLEIIHYFHTAVVHTTYPTIWFLPSLWVGITITYLLSARLSGNWILSIAFFLCLLGAIGGGYSQLIPNQSIAHNIHEWYTKIMITYRNGFFNGMPFVTLGMFIAKSPNQMSRHKNLFFTLLFSGAYVAEAIIIKHFNLSPNVDLGIFMFPAIYFLFSLIIQFDFKEKGIYRILRNLSMLIFLGQRLFLSAIPALLPNLSTKIRELPNGIILLLFVSLVIGFSWGVIKLSDQYKKLKILW